MNLVTSFYQLNGLFGDIINTIVSFIVNIITGLLAHVGVSLYNALILPLYIIADGVFIVFRKFAGLDTYSYGGEYIQGDVVLSLINDPVVQNVFWSLVILGIVLLIISTIIAVIKSEMATFEEKSKNTKSKILVKALKALVNMFMVPTVAILGIFMGNAVLKSLDQATNGTGENIAVSGMVFKAAAYNCNRARRNIEFAEDLMKDGPNSFGIIKGVTQEEIALSLDNAFASNTVIDWQKLEIPDINIFSNDIVVYAHVLGLTLFSYGSIYLPRYSMSVYDSCFVAYYYDLLSFNYLIGIVVLVFASYVLLVTAIGLVKRMFKLTMLLVIAPPIAAISPLDDGKALGKWRGEFIGSTLSAYGTVVGLNLFILLLGPLQKINFFAVSTGNEDANLIINGLTGALLNPLIQLLILCAGLIFFKEMPKMLGGLIGAEDAFGEGAKAAGELAKKAGQVAAVASGAGGAAMAAGKAAAAKKLAAQAGKKAKGLGSKMKKLEDKKKNGGTLSKKEEEQLNKMKLDKEKLEKEEKDQTTKASSYEDLATAKLSQAKTNGLSLATGGLSDQFSKSFGDKDVQKAKATTDRIEKREKQGKQLLNKKQKETKQKVNKRYKPKINAAQTEVRDLSRELRIARKSPVADEISLARKENELQEAKERVKLIKEKRERSLKRSLRPYKPKSELDERRIHDTLIEEYDKEEKDKWAKEMDERDKKKYQNPKKKNKK